MARQPTAGPPLSVSWIDRTRAAAVVLGALGLCVVAVAATDLQAQTPSRPAAERAAGTSSHQLSDAEVAQAISTAFRRNPHLLVRSIDVQVTDGVVTLSGQVGTQEVSEEAEGVARETAGVARVVNTIAVRPGTAANDPALANSIGDALAREEGIERRQITVQASDGVVTLTGLVADSAAKARAERTARNVGGVVQVMNRLQIAPESGMPGTNPRTPDARTPDPRGADPRGAAPQRLAPLNPDPSAPGPSSPSPASPLPGASPSQLR